MPDPRAGDFKIKICGVRSPADVAVVRGCGGDAIGLNFVPASIRYVEPDAARQISAAAEGLVRVGVFTDHNLDQIARTAELAQLDRIQLHGDHGLPQATQLQAATDRRVVLVVRLPTGRLSASDLDARLDPLLQAGIDTLIDSYNPREFGGTGLRLDWESVGEWIEQRRPPFWILAGGLTPENVAEAIVSSRAVAVDVASGVEQPKGVKSEARIRQFVQAAAPLL